MTTPEPGQRWKGTTLAHPQKVEIVKVSKLQVHYTHIDRSVGKNRRHVVSLRTEAFTNAYRPL